MCDLDTQQDAEAFLAGNESKLKTGTAFSRREFGLMTAVAGSAILLPPVANAQSVVESDVDIATQDGVADCYFVHPAQGSHAAVIVWPDILGLRPAFRAMGKRLAQSGYSVLVVNPFYRDARSPVVGEGASFGQPETREIVLWMLAQWSRFSMLNLRWIHRDASVQQAIAWAAQWSCVRWQLCQIALARVARSMVAAWRPMQTIARIYLSRRLSQRCCTVWQLTMTQPTLWLKTRLIPRMRLQVFQPR